MSTNHSLLKKKEKPKRKHSFAQLRTGFRLAISRGTILPVFIVDRLAFSRLVTSKRSLGCCRSKKKSGQGSKYDEVTSPRVNSPSVTAVNFVGKSQADWQPTKARS